ncbi:acyl-CoA thioester hydrolase [Marivirga sericea]|uniref:Acyl-CoA thioester hydrolase n=1 Tax=Marivirga sericea TaxID=1028 RepID=A0A1X7IQ46_9BACT|nr:thioesterase family protein [Marivirga sericea]SMG16925.1 acyl-CoA thioester hydrolase [Marivirga sericea]
MSKFQLEIETKATDFDGMGHINNVVYLQWVQDVAEAHWKYVSGKNDHESNLWVALRHEIDYKKEIKPDEKIVAETWVASMEGVKSERMTRIFNPETAQTKAEARTFWCLIDANTKRPKRIPEEMKERYKAP